MLPKASLAASLSHCHPLGAQQALQGTERQRLLSAAWGGDGRWHWDGSPPWNSGERKIKSIWNQTSCVNSSKRRMRKGNLPPVCFTPSQGELRVESLLLYSTRTLGSPFWWKSRIWSKENFSPTKLFWCQKLEDFWVSPGSSSSDKYWVTVPWLLWYQVILTLFGPMNMHCLLKSQSDLLLCFPVTWNNERFLDAYNIWKNRMETFLRNLLFAYFSIVLNQQRLITEVSEENKIRCIRRKTKLLYHKYHRQKKSLKTKNQPLGYPSSQLAQPTPLMPKFNVSAIRLAPQSTSQ